MTDIAERRLHGIAVYNPDLLSKQELVAQFVARRELFSELVADLRRPKFTQHQLIVGHRGMGKTTLLRRLRYAVEDDPKLSSRWIALAFPEEQYNVIRLSDLYLNCVDALSDALERTGHQNEADALDDAREKLPEDDESHRAAAALDLLLGTARRLKRRLLLLVDNLDLIFDRLKADQWTIRELLSRENRLLLIGATPFVIGATYEYDAPFYDFFRVHELRGLSFDETSEVLATLAREMSAPDVERLVRDEPARIRTLHVLAGGNPRTIVLLFSVLAQGTDGDVRSDLEKLLDQSTPLYKARFEALPPQAQQVIDALAIHWDPISAAELAEKLRFDVNIVSSQLNRLAQQGVVQKVAYDPSSKTGFQIAERFFNIWYLMRASRRVRRRLTWLVQFLRLFYGLDQLRRKAHILLCSPSDTMPLRKAELCLAIAEALGEDRPTQLALESRAIRAMLATDDLRREMQCLFDLDGEDAALKLVIDRQLWSREYQSAINAAPDRETAELLRMMGGLITDVNPHQKLLTARNVVKLSGEAQQQLRQLMIGVQQYLRRLLGGVLVDQMSDAILGGYVSKSDDEEALSTASAALNKPGLELLPLTRSLPLEKLREIALTTDDALAWAQYAMRLARAGQASESRVALERISSGAGSLARMEQARVEHMLGHHDTAIAILGTLLTDMRFPPEFWYLAAAYDDVEEHGLAGDILRKGLELYPQEPHLLLRYGNLLIQVNRSQEAHQIFEKLVSIEPLNDAGWGSLAIALLQQNRPAEALQAVEQGLQCQASISLSIIRIAVVMFLEQPIESLLVELSLAQSVPRETGAAINLAQIIVSMSWEISAHLLRLVLPRAAAQWDEPDVTNASLELFASLARNGHALPTAALLEELNLHEPLRPVHEALRIHGYGDRDGLNRLAPELRDPVVQLLDAWQPPNGSSLSPPKKRRSNRVAAKTRRRIR